MNQNHELILRIHDQLEKAKKVLVVSHLRPDGDAIGSLLGIGLALIDAKKEVQMVLSDALPENFCFLAGSEQIKTKPEGKFDYTIVVDSADIERTDTALAGFGKPDLNIDHHKTNTNFASTNLVVDGAVATSEILAEYLPKFGFKITNRIATALLTGIVTDTIGFRTTNVNPNVLQLVAHLMKLGADLSYVYYKTITEQSLAATRYWAAGLSKIQMEDGLVWTTLSLKERKEAGYELRDDADLIKILSAIDGAKIAVILTEQTGGCVKISWRLCGSSPMNLDVSEIALQYGGGGHKAAAGADVKGNLEEVLENVLSNTRLYMQQILQPIEEYR